MSDHFTRHRLVLDVRRFELPLVGSATGQFDELAGFLFRDDFYTANPAGFVQFQLEIDWKRPRQAPRQLRRNFRREGVNGLRRREIFATRIRAADRSE